MAWGLQLSALLLGAAGMAHCAAMCSAPCAAAARACAVRAGSQSSWPSQMALQAGRLTGYAMLGAMAAASVGFLRGYFEHVSGLRPLWLLMQLALLFSGLVVLATGRVPGLAGFGAHAVRLPALAPAATRSWPGAALAFPSGLAWALLPCAQLYAGVALASMADDPLAAAGVMLAFGLPGTIAVLSGPLLWRLLRRVYMRFSSGPQLQVVRLARAGEQAGVPAGSSWNVRLAGASIALAAAWLLLHSSKSAVAWWCA
ncbi:MAG: sulfite exporter TauE/SafE family protein [Aquabacterium sp.]|nr:MAG: sulfite exporter TauE/SafE family protein [Aquabacterium sp.]